MFKRIISLAPSNTEIIYALNAQDNLIACTRYCDFPKEAGKKPKIGGWLDINDELVKKFNPDLILASTFVQDRITERYKKDGMNIAALMPKTLDGVFDSMIEIGSLLNKENEAKNLVSSMKTRINIIQSKIKNNSKPRVYIEEWHKPPHVSGNWVPKLAEIAGGKFGLIKEGAYSRPVTDDEIQYYDPEIIILSICGLAEKAKAEWIIKRKNWENLSAVKNSKVFVVDDSLLNRPGPRLVDGLKKLAEMINQ